MLTGTTDPSDTSRAFRALAEAFRNSGAVEVESRAGFPGGNEPVSALWLPEYGIWLASKRLPQAKYRKYWNALGVEDPHGRAQIAITVEINFSLEGTPGRNFGGVAKDAGGRLVLVHSGRTGGNRRVPAETFWKEYSGPADTLESVGAKPRRVAYFPLDSPLLVQQLANFTHTMAKLKGRRVAAPRSSVRPVELSAEEVLPGAQFMEGAARSVLVNAYERNRRARAVCLRHYGRSCLACGFNFDVKYGAANAEGYVQVHHVVPLATIGAAYRLDPIRDLRPVCPNCHAIIHRREPPFSVEEVAGMIRLVK